MAFQLLLDGLHLFRLALRLFHLLVGILFHLVDAVFGAGQLAFTVLAGLFVFVLHLEELFLGLQDAFFLDDFGFLLGLFKQDHLFFDDCLFQQGGRDEVTHRKAHDQSRCGNDNPSSV